MPPHVTRRTLPALALGLLVGRTGAARAGGADARALAAVEADAGGRLGVAALDTGTGRRVEWRADERFPVCSVWKMLAGAAILSRVDRGTLSLDRSVPFGPADLLEYAPVTRAAVGRGSMTVGALCEAAVRWSDNTAANLLLGLLGGPAGWTAYARSLGDGVSRLDRTEPALNEALPGDPRDTTTPAAMVRDMHAVLLGDALSAGSRARLLGWMEENRLTGALLRAGVPAGWRVADKSGAGERGTRDDAGVMWPPEGATVLAAVFLTGAGGTPAARDAAIARVAGVIARG